MFVILAQELFIREHTKKKNAVIPLFYSTIPYHYKNIKHSITVLNISYVL